MIYVKFSGGLGNRMGESYVVLLGQVSSSSVCCLSHGVYLIKDLFAMNDIRNLMKDYYLY